jgi:hypothetical protein
MKNYNKVKFYADASVQTAPDSGIRIDPTSIEKLTLEDTLSRGKRYSNSYLYPHLNLYNNSGYRDAQKLLQKKHRIIKTSTNNRETYGISHAPFYTSPYLMKSDHYLDGDKHPIPEIILSNDTTGGLDPNPGTGPVGPSAGK